MCKGVRPSLQNWLHIYAQQGCRLLTSAKQVVGEFSLLLPGAYWSLLGWQANFCLGIAGLQPLEEWVETVMV